MIRRATFNDGPAIEAMIREMHQASKYRGRFEISDKALGTTVLGLIAQQGQYGPQGTFIAVAEENGAIVGFIAGVLQRIYMIANKLEAQDLYFHVRPGNGQKHSLRLVDAFVAWAAGNPKVLEIKASSNDVVPGGERVGDIFRRKGFVQIGEVFEMRLDAAREEAA